MHDQPLTAGRPFQVKASVGRQLEREKRKIGARLAPLVGGKEPKMPGAPEFNAPEAKFAWRPTLPTFFRLLDAL